MKLDVDPTIDCCFKKLFGEEVNALLTVHLLNAVTQTRRPVTGVEFVVTFSQKDSPLDKLTIGDLKVRDQGNRQYQVEMQRKVDWFFGLRALFDWAQFHTQQLQQGEHYQTLRPTVLICFLKEAFFEFSTDFHLVFEARERNSGQLLCDSLEVHLIQLSRFTKEPKDLTTDLDRWCYFLRHGAELDRDALPASLNVPMIRRAMEILTVFTQEERERELYYQRLKAERDRRSWEYEYEQRGLRLEEAEKRLQEKEKQQEEAEKKRLEAEKSRMEAEKSRMEAENQAAKAKLIGRIQLCQEMLGQEPTAEEELLQLSKEELQHRLTELRQQLPLPRQ